LFERGAIVPGDDDDVPVEIRFREFGQVFFEKRGVRERDIVFANENVWISPFFGEFNAPYMTQCAPDGARCRFYRGKSFITIGVYFEFFELGFDVFETVFPVFEIDIENMG
jgi:hypothetical protein